MELETSKFGVIEIDPDDIIRLTRGLYGFEEYSRYIIIHQDNSIFSFLQSVEEPWLSFVIIMPELIVPDYKVVLEENHVAELGLEDATQGQVYVILTIPDAIADMTANLQAPLIINSYKKIAKQIILMEDEYTTRFRLFPKQKKSDLHTDHQEAKAT